MVKNSGQIIRRYATALFELTVENNVVKDVFSQVQLALSALSPDVVSMLVNPAYSDADKKDVIATLIKSIQADPVLKGFLELVQTNRRFIFLKEILKEFLVRADDHMGMTRVEIHSAKALSSTELGEFESSLSLALKRKVILTPKVDEALKAGYLIKIGNTIVDASLRSRLANLKESLSQGV